MRFRTLTRAYRALGVLKALSGALGAVVAATLKADATDVALHAGNTAAAKLVWIQAHAWIIVPLLLLAIPVLEWTRRRLGDPKMWALVHDVLDQFREKIFQDAADEPKHYHRVTLFEHVGWCWSLRRWPWSGWLRPVERSGHTTQKSRTLFRAPDEAQKIEGVAGMAWSRRRMLFVADLPDLQKNPTDADVEDYARRTSMTPDAVRRSLPKGRSFCGIPVEANGRLWGVIVVDSRRPVMKKQPIRTHYNLVARFLGKVLERM